MIRHLAAAAAAALIAAVFAVAPAPARAAPPPCGSGYCVNWQLNASGCGAHCTEYISQVEWTANPAPRHYARGHIVCKLTSGSGTETLNGGWVTSLNLWSAAHCQAPYAVLRAGWQVKSTSSGSITTVWGCNPCPTSPVRRA